MFQDLKNSRVAIRSFFLSLFSGVGAHCQSFGHPDEDGAGSSETHFFKTLLYSHLGILVTGEGQQ